MLLKLLGVIDILSAIVFWLFYNLNVLPLVLVLILGVFLMLKGIYFSTLSKSVSSALDILVGLVVVSFSTIGLPVILVLLLSLYLLQKGVVSLL